MSRLSLNLAGVANPEVRNDGATAKFTLLGAHGKSVIVTAPFERLKSLESMIMNLLTVMGANRSIASSEPTEYEPMMDSYQVNGLDVVYHPEQGNLDLRVVSRNGEAFQVSFLPHHVEGLRGIFRQIEDADRLSQNLPESQTPPN
jgi:hypothetical protein